MTELKAKLTRLLGSSESGLTYEQGRLMLDHPDKVVRCGLARRTDLDPEMLFFLAGDPDPEVRLAVANNTSAPGKSWVSLAEDQNEDIRMTLASRLPGLLGTQPVAASDRATRALVSSLRLLVRDELPRVRQRLSQALAEMPDAPHDIVAVLARDPIEAIAIPIIELSPVLTDSDLIEIITASPLTGTLTAVSQRAKVSFAVADALVNSGDAKAIEKLLRNPAAHIREETLDLIADMAPGHHGWHEPLVRRPGLNPSIVAKITRFVTDELVEVLAQRTDLDPSTLVYVRHVCLNRLEKRDGIALSDPLIEATSDAALRRAVFRAESLQLTGQLSTATIMENLTLGPSALVIAMLALQSGIPVRKIADAARSGMARGLLAVSWAADLTAEEAVMVQNKLGRVSPDKVIRPAPLGFYAASEAELQSQIEQLRDPVTIDAD